MKDRALFAARRDALMSQVALLREQHSKIGQEVVALRAQITQAGESLKCRPRSTSRGNSARRCST